MKRLALLLAACAKPTPPAPPPPPPAPMQPWLTLTPKMVLFDDRVVVALVDGEPDPSDLENGARGTVILRLRDAATRALTREPGPLRVLVDPALPFRTFYRVIASVVPAYPHPTLDDALLAIGAADGLVIHLPADRARLDAMLTGDVPSATIVADGTLPMSEVTPVIDEVHSHLARIQIAIALTE